MQRSTKLAICLIATLSVFSAVLLIKGLVSQVPSGTWASAGTMAQARSGASSALLQDGRILIIGGDGGSGAVASVEVFGTDGSISALPSLNYARSQHTSTVLQDGRVLVAGGTGLGGTVTDTAEIYDPTATTWTAAGLMMEPRSGHTATLLTDGRVAIAGGQSSGVSSKTVEIYDPTANTFSLASAPLSSPRSNHAAALLPDGRVLIVGGTDGTNTSASSDIFDPATGLVSAGPALSTPRQGHSATPQLDRKILVAGGSNGTADLATAEVYDPAAGTFSLPGNTLTTARSGHLAFLLPHNASVLIVGGTSGGVAQSSVEQYYPWTGTFNATGAMAAARAGAAGASLSSQDGLLLVTGGKDATGTTLASTELYGFATVKTDKFDYVPGETVTITGSGWQPGETVTLTLQEVPFNDTHGPYTAVADSNGNIVNTDFVPNAADVGIRFYLTATGSVSQAQTTFTDANPGSTTDVACSPTSVALNAPSTCTATVKGTGQGQTTPTGTVSWTSNGSGSFSSSTCTLSGSGNSATCSVTYTPSVVGTGTHTIRGSYFGGSGYPASSGTFGLTVTKRSTSTTLSLSPSTVVVGQGSTVTVTVTDTDTGTKSNPTGTVVVSSSDGTDSITGTCTLTAGGTGVSTCTATVTPAQVGTNPHTITANFSATTVHAASSGSANLTVNKASTSLTITNSVALATSSVVGQAYEVDWTFSVTAPGSGTPSGNVTVSDGTSTCSASPATGKCNLTSTTPGSPKTITATYPGDANFSTSTSTGVSHTVNKADTTTTITNAGALGTATVVGQAYAVNYSVTVNSPGSGTPTGNVTVSDGSQTCIASVAAATCNLTSTTVGSPKTITTTYTPGDTNFNASPASAGVAHTVNKADTTAAITSDSPDPSVVGQAVTVKYTVSVTAPGGGTIPGTGSVHVTDGVDFCDGTVAAGQCSVSLSTAGTRTLTATYQGDGANYNASPASPGESHTVDTPASLSFTASVAFDSSATPADTIVRATQFVTVKLTITNSGQSGATGVTPPSMSFSATGTASTTPCGAGSPASGSIAGTGGPGPNTMSYNYSCGPVSGDGTLKFTTSGQASGKDAISGNTVSTTGSIDSNLVTVDSTPPTVTVTPASGSYTVGTTLAVNWSASDTGGAGAPPGLGTGVTCSVVIDGGAPTTNCNSSTSFGAGSHTIAVTGTDGAGNVTTVNRSYTITVDSTPPVITPTVTPAPNGAGWNNTNPTVTWSVTDPESGIASSTGCGSTTVSTETTGLVVTCSATNGAALSSSNSVTIKLDKTPPTASATPSPAANANGWNNTNVTVTFSGSDALSGIDHCDSPTTLSAEAAGQSASGTCTDKAGNMSATATASGINIDKTPPTASATPSPAANANGWNNTNVTVTFSGSDALSGIDSCDAPVTLSSEGAGQSASGKCTDKAGNMSAAATASGINIDKTPPSLSGNRSPAANANGWNNVDVTATFTCSDGLSGVDVGPVNRKW